MTSVKSLGDQTEIASTASKCHATGNPFDRFSDELLEQIISLVGLSGNAISADPFGVGWQEKTEMVREALEQKHALRPLRLVSWRFFCLTTPLFFKRIIISDSEDNWNVDRCGGFILRLSTLLGSGLLPRAEIPKQSMSLDSSSAPPARGHCRSHEKNGDHVRQLIISYPYVSAIQVFRILDAIQPLLPSLNEISSLNLSYLPLLLSPAVSFPRLEALTGIDVGLAPDEWTAGLYSPSFARPPSFVISSRFFPQEILLGFINHHPTIRRLALRGVYFDCHTITRLIALLRSNLLVVPLLPHFRRSPQFSGLNTLHIGCNSVVDLQLFRRLPTAMPHLQELHVDAGCHLVDEEAEQNDQWTLEHLVRALPQLTHFTFIGQHDLPSLHRSLVWVASEQLVQLAPGLKSLNLRADSFGTHNFFNNLGRTSLERLNVWHKPFVPTESESWSIISFECPEAIGRLGYFARALVQAGLEWPKEEGPRRDLWLKLRALSLIKTVTPEEEEARWYELDGL